MLFSLCVDRLSVSCLSSRSSSITVSLVVIIQIFSNYFLGSGGFCPVFQFTIAFESLIYWSIHFYTEEPIIFWFSWHMSLPQFKKSFFKCRRHNECFFSNHGKAHYYSIWRNSYNFALQNYINSAFFIILLSHSSTSFCNAQFSPKIRQVFVCFGCFCPVFSKYCPVLSPIICFSPPSFVPLRPRLSFFLRFRLSFSTFCF